MIAPSMLILALMSAPPKQVVLIVPLEAEGATWTVAQGATERIVAAARSLPGIEVVSPERINRQLGVNLALQARSCAKEIFCLVQIGEAVSAQRMLTGELERKGDEANILRLNAVDIERAQMIETLRWSVPVRSGALEDAISAAVRRLLIPPDARVIFDVDPPDAKLELYGESIRYESTKETPFWAGVYFGRVTAPGFEPRDIRFSVPSGGPTRIPIELEPDPLYVGLRPRARSKSSQGASSESSSGLAGSAPVETPSGPSALANWYAWSLLGAGATASVVGGVIMSGGQADYNRYSAEPRYLGDGHTADEAASARAGARSQVSAGSTVMVIGIGVAAGGLVWMLIDAIISDSASQRAAQVTTLKSRGEG